MISLILYRGPVETEIILRLMQACGRPINGIT